MTHTAMSPDFENLIDLDAPITRIGTGFKFAEGPIWHPRDRNLLFSDLPGDVRQRWDPASGARRGQALWGGDDFRTLFLTATQSVYAVTTKVGPRPEPYMGWKAR